MSVPEMVSDSLYNNSLVVQTNCCIRCQVAVLDDDNLAGEDAGCRAPELVWLHVSCDCEESWMYCQVLVNITGDKFCDICGIVLCDKTVHFYCDHPKAQLRDNDAV